MFEYLKNKIAATLVFLFRRRSRRGWWAYLIWVLPYLLVASWFAADVNLSLSRQLPLLLPIVLVIVQWVWPTVLGWAVIFTPTFLYFCDCASYLVQTIKDCFASNPDIEGIVCFLIFLGLLFSMCSALVLALIFSIKPKRTTSTNSLQATAAAPASCD